MRAFALALISIGLLLASCGPTGTEADDVTLSADLPPVVRVAIGGKGDPCVGDVSGRSGRIAFPVVGVDATMRELAAGHPVLLVRKGDEDGWPWRCSIVFGYDPGQVHLRGPVGEHHAMPIGKFGRLWHGSGVAALVVLPPGAMPASAREDVYLRSVAGLTRNGMAWESVIAFDAALAAWPGSSGALVGLGDALVALGDLDGAVNAYRDAVARGPNPTSALARLAGVLGGTKGGGETDETVLAESPE